MAPAPRFRRCCPVHGVELRWIEMRRENYSERPVCPVGDHSLEEWIVLDLRSGRIVGHGSLDEAPLEDEDEPHTTHHRVMSAARSPSTSAP